MCEEEAAAAAAQEFLDKAEHKKKEKTRFFALFRRQLALSGALSGKKEPEKCYTYTKFNALSLSLGCGRQDGGRISDEQLPGS